MQGWIKWTKGLSLKREVVAMATALKIDRRMVAALCMELWEWADENTVDGNVPGVTVSIVDEITRVDGFAQAMSDERWLFENDEGIWFPNFERHNGKSAKRRAQTNARVEGHRRKAKPKSNAADVTEALPEKRREEKPPKAPQGGQGLADSIMLETYCESYDIDFDLIKQAFAKKIDFADVVIAVEILAGRGPDRFNGINHPLALFLKLCQNLNGVKVTRPTVSYKQHCRELERSATKEVARPWFARPHKERTRLFREYVDEHPGQLVRAVNGIIVKNTFGFEIDPDAIKQAAALERWLSQRAAQGVN